MLANVDEIVADVRSLLDEPTAAENKFYVDAEIIRWVNEGSDVFTTLTRVLCKYYNYTLASGNIKHDRELRLNSDFITFDEGSILYNDKPLTEVSIQELDEYKGTDWRSHTGTSHSYYRRSDYVGFYPKPVIGDTVKYYGIERAKVMVADDGVAPLSADYRMVAFRRYIRDYAMAFCWYKKGEMRYYHEKMDEFDKGVGLVNQIVHGAKNQPSKMIPARRRTSRYNVNALNM